MSKERIIVSLCSSMLGEKMKPLVIGKSRKPHYFRNIDPHTLPVIYRDNKKAWMTSKIYEYEKRTDMELCQGDNTPSLKQTNQEHTS